MQRLPDQADYAEVPFGRVEARRRPVTQNRKIGHRCLSRGWVIAVILLGSLLRHGVKKIAQRCHDRKSDDSEEDARKRKSRRSKAKGGRSEARARRMIAIATQTEASAVYADAGAFISRRIAAVISVVVARPPRSGVRMFPVRSTVPTASRIFRAAAS